MNTETNEPQVDNIDQNVDEGKKETTESTESTDPVFDHTSHKYKFEGLGDDEYDWEYVNRNVSTNVALDRKGKEHAENVRNFQQIIAAAKTNPDVLLKELGIDPFKYAETKLSVELDWQKMSPEQQQSQRYQDELEQLKREKTQRENYEEKQTAIAQQHQLRQEIEGEIVSVLDGANLPSDDRKLKVRLMKDIASLVYATRIKSHQTGVDMKMTPAQAAPIVMQQYRQHIAHFIASLPGDEIVTALGPEAAKKFNKALLAQAKAGNMPSLIKDTAGTGQIANTKKKMPKIKTSDDYVSQADWQEANRERLKNRK